MAGEQSSNNYPRELAEALDLMMQAQDFLDDHRAPGEIGAHLDLAICCLREHLGMTFPKF